MKDEELVGRDDIMRNISLASHLVSFMMSCEAGSSSTRQQQQQDHWVRRINRQLR